MKPLSLKIFSFLAAISLLSLASCTSDEPAPRSENDICGAWVSNEGNYMYFKLPNICYKLIPESEEMAQLAYDAYYYEPGYNILMYMSEDSHADIYQVTELNQNEMKWVWADNIIDGDNLLNEKYKGMSKSEILGSIIKQAQEGFDLDYSRTTVFNRISMEEFEEVLIDYGYEWVIEEL
ncbi:MAG: hypothetical protein HDR88_04475 [Bacteroides sp.]|nr:hypothetical protein [Bacteroides sp.]